MNAACRVNPADKTGTVEAGTWRGAAPHIERTHPGYDEYRYQVDELGHNPYELTSYLIAKLRTYTRENVQGELRALFEAQYKLTSAAKAGSERASPGMV